MGHRAHNWICTSRWFGHPRTVADIEHPATVDRTACLAMEVHTVHRTTEARTAHQAMAAVEDELRVVEVDTTEAAAAAVGTLAEVVADTLRVQGEAIRPVEAVVTEEDTARAYEL